MAESPVRSRFRYQSENRIRDTWRANPSLFIDTSISGLHGLPVSFFVRFERANGLRNPPITFRLLDKVVIDFAAPLVYDPPTCNSNLLPIKKSYVEFR